MKLTIASHLPIERGRVFAALVDPEILRRTLPGCEELTTTGEDAYAVRLRIGIAGLKGSYHGNVTIGEKRPPESLTLAFDGKGAPGFVRGSAVLTLSADGDGTAIAGDADVQVGGVIAAVGSRLLGAAAKKLAGDFFNQIASTIDQTDHQQPITND